MDLRERRELTNGAGNAYARAFELVLTPVFLGALGWSIDGWLGTRPWFMVGFAAATWVYLIWKFLKGYDVEMREREARVLRRSTGGLP